MALQLSPDYGFVILVGIAAYFMLMWMAMQVMNARKKYDVQYPDMYSATSKEFNCIQRVHQNTLENITYFLFFLLFGGLHFPRLCAACGALWIVSRVVYAKGYYTFNPANRNYGVFGYIGLLGLLISTILSALNLLGVV